MSKLTTLSSLIVSALLLGGASAQAADVFPTKEFFKPDEPITVKFVNGKSEDAKKAVADLGVAAAKLDFLFTAAPVADIADAFKIFNVAGEEQKLGKSSVKPDGSVDLTEACPALKSGGTFFLTWKDATPLVIEVLFNPTYQMYKAKIQTLAPDQKKAALEQFGPAVTHVELASYAQITTDKGVIKAKFAYDDAPHTVDNFIALARGGMYDNSSFHRIITGFMIQGGDSYANTPKAGSGGPGYNITHEFSDKKHTRGVLSMARQGGDVKSPQGSTQTTQYDTAGSQFFIMHADSTHLDGIYTPFGDVFEGLPVVDLLAKTPTSDENGTVAGPKPKLLSLKILPASPEIYNLISKPAATTPAAPK
jgi:peptidyl-prolyl cis-trans isomerase B (cyclophilin B)